MAFITKKYLFRLVSYHKLLKRYYWQSNMVRSTFYNYFNEKGHQFAPPSSVIPLADSSLTFVNAGMNQFKPVFLGLEEPIYKMAYNSQKCIRVGGKHNDLSDVGYDSFHHTFFEMLGSWSFGNYFKEESCKFAWSLLTDVYKISPKNLFVTYFCGDDNLELLPDIETKKVWLRIGVPESHILPFGCKENFWEMGSKGPCGPCTEIHYSHDPIKYNAQYVNKGLENLVELWNIVFVQYERHEDGHISPLSNHYVDTGMGLERITAVLNGKISNYDTDLFSPLFEKLHQLSGKPRYSGKFGDGSEMDTAYRILADHSRMISISLSDNLLPNDCPPLKSIIRRCLDIGYTQFGFSENDDWLRQLCECNVKILGEAHPLLQKNMNNAKEILSAHEKMIWDTTFTSKSTWDEMTKLYTKLAEVSVVYNNLVTSVHSNINTFERLCESGECYSTDNAVKFIMGSNVSEDNFKIIMDAFGVTCDFEEIFLIVKQHRETTNVTDHGSESESESVVSTSNNSYLNAIQHLVLAALNVEAGKVYYRCATKTSNSVTLDVLSFHTLTLQHILQTEDLVRHWIKCGLNISRKLVPLREALVDNNCIINYRKTHPLQVWMVSIPTEEQSASSVLMYDEPYVDSTSQIGDFTFDKIIFKNYGNISLRAICGQDAKTLHSKVAEIRKSVDEWKAVANDAIDRNLRLREVFVKWTKWKQRLIVKKMPATFLLQITGEIDPILEKVRIIVQPPSNIEEILEEGREKIKLHDGDGIYHQFNIDFRGWLPNLLFVFDGNEKFPIVFLAKGWGKFAVVASVPQESDISLKKMFEEIQPLFNAEGQIKFKSNSKNVGCLLYWKGIKYAEIQKIHEVFKICKSFMKSKT